MLYKERKCRVCGCTWHQACPGGCSWVEIDLCSACMGKEALTGAMTPDESAAVVRKALGEPDYTYVVVKHGGRTITIVPRFPEAVRSLLEGYEAAKPRVLTLREVQCYQDCPIIWLETGGNDGWRDANQVISFYAHPDSKQSKQYGISWRCWSARPTPEQLSSIPWGRGPELAGRGNRDQTFAF